MSLSIDGIKFNKSSAPIKQSNVDKTSTEDIFTTYKNTKGANNTEFDPKKQQKVMNAIAKALPHREAVYRKISQYTGVSEYKDFPIEAKNIANKINDFCNSMFIGKMEQAKNSSDIDAELKNCLQEIAAKSNECLAELKELYEPKEEKNDNKKSFLDLFPFNKQTNSTNTSLKFD